MNFHKINIIICFRKKALFFLRILLLILSLSLIQNRVTAQKKGLDDSKNTKDKIVKSKTDTIKTDSATLKLVSKDAIKDKIEYNCTDSMMFDLPQQKVYMYGAGNIQTQEMELKSNFIEIDTKKSYLTATGIEDSTKKVTGSPEFKQGTEEFKAKIIKYSFKTKQGIVTDVITQENGGYIHGSVTKMHTNKEIHILDGKYTTCDLDHPHFYVELTKAKIIPGKRIISGPMYFVIADIPIPIGLPFGYIPSRKNAASGIIIPSYGEEDRRGFFLRDGGYYWAVNDYLDAALLGNIYTQGSWGLNLRSNFRRRYHQSGNMDIKLDNNVFGEKGLEGYSSSRAFWVQGTYAQDNKANPTSNFSFNLNFGTSKFNQLNAIQNINQYAQNTTSSSIAYTKQFPETPFSFSANVNSSQNLTEKTVNLTFPSLTFNMNRIFPFKGKSSTSSSNWYQKIGISMNSNLANQINTFDTLLFKEKTLYNMENGFKYSVPIGTSFNILKFVNVSPSISYNGRIYTRSIRKYNEKLINGEMIDTAWIDTLRNINHVYDFGFSVPFSTKLYGIFNFRKGKIKAFRHVLTPSVSYNYRPDFGTEFWNYYALDPTDSTNTRKYSYYQGAMYGTPASGKMGSVGFTLGNNFEMKVRSSEDTVKQEKKIKLLESLNFNTSYNLAVDSLNWSDISVSGGTRLFENISVTFNANFDPYTVNEKGQTINKYEWDKNSRVARFTNGGITLTSSFKSKQKKTDKTTGKDETKDKIKPQIPYYYPYPEIPYADFNVPWSLNVSYSLNYSKSQFNIVNQNFDSNIIQSLNFSGNLSLTDKWQISARADYDLEVQKFVHTGFTIHRDLHCWEMGLSVVPFGTLKSYNFRINIKSSIFQGIEYKKQKSWLDNQ